MTWPYIHKPMKIWQGRGQQWVVVAVLTPSMCGCGGWAGGWESCSPSWGRVIGLFGGRRADAESWGKLERQETEEGWWTSQEMMRLRTCWRWDTQRKLGRQKWWGAWVFRNEIASPAGFPSNLDVYMNRKLKLCRVTNVTVKWMYSSKMRAVSRRVSIQSCEFNLWAKLLYRIKHLRTSTVSIQRVKENKITSW